MAGWKSQQSISACRIQQQATWHRDLRGRLSYKGPVWFGVHSQAGWKDCARRQWSPQSHNLQSDRRSRMSRTCNTVASLPAWRTDCTCHHSHRLNEAPTKGCKDFCRSVTLEAVGMNGQIDWQARQISNLVYSLAGHRCSEAWGTFWTWTGQNNTALIAWGKRNGERRAAEM